ncbi:28450_t:CDS:2, partial [Dentiscutata erythropus]
PIYPQYTPSNSDNSKEDKVTESKQNEKVTMPNLFLESDNQLLELLSLAMRKKIIDPSTKNKWPKSLEYMQCRIEDIIIPDGLYTTVIQDNNSKNQTFDFSTKINTKEEPVSNEKKESQTRIPFQDSNHIRYEKSRK